MPFIGKFSVWIDSEGERLREYNIHYDSQTKTKTCWIPSDAGKKFKIYCQDDGCRCVTAYVALLDGQKLPFCETVEPRYDSLEPVCFKGVDTPHGLAPFIFSPCIFIDEDTPNVSMCVDSEIGDIKVFVYKARVVKAKKKKKTKKKQTKENKTAGNKNSTPERTRAPGPEHANAPEPTHAPEPANTISSNMTKKPGPELLFPELLLNERKKSIGLVHGIQLADFQLKPSLFRLGEVQRPNDSTRSSMETIPMPMSVVTNPSMPIALNPVSTAGPGGSRLERQEPVFQERQGDPEESDSDDAEFLLAEGYVGYVQKLRLPRAQLPIREQIEDRSIALAMAGTGLNVENDMSTAATDPADLDPTSDPQDLPELDNTPWKVKIDELQAVLSQPDRMPVLPDPENVIDLTLDSDDVVLANAQEKMRVLQSQMAELQSVIESVAVTQKRPLTRMNDTVPNKRVKLEPKDTPINSGVVPEKEIKRED
ncbi:hypothetical protein BJ165DRAFT_1408339 [Panaeolus papilionaceus]|nr:hypothetical protein BJ165DRAFT_1408339 [Panaeolus papilionaceus]